MASVRYLVKDVDAAVAFYVEALGFSLQQQFGPAMAIVATEGLTLWLAGPAASAARPMPDGRQPEPGGWNRFVLQVADIEAKVAESGADEVMVTTTAWDYDMRLRSYRLLAEVFGLQAA